MAGISSKALAFGNPENNKKYNGIERENDLQIDVYDAQFRELDGQTGVWWQIDPKTEKMEMWSPYVSNYDNPLRYSDPLGDEGQECCGELLDDIKDAAKETWRSIKQGAKDVKNFGVDFYKDGVLPGMDWLNENLNPLVSVAEVTSGKSYRSNFTQEKSRVQSGSELALSIIPGGKVEGVIVRNVEKQVAKNTEKSLAKEVENVVVHGNSKASTKPTTLYRLETKEGVYLKTGITSATIPEKRYTREFMRDKVMIPLDKGVRSEIMVKERLIVEKNPGPLNKEPWAGKQSY